MTKEEVKNKFLSDALEHGNAVSEGDHKKANMLHKKLHELYALAKNNNHLDVFSNELENNDNHIKLWAATFSLSNHQEEATLVIEKLIKDETNVSADAELVLRLWKENKLNLL